MDSEPKEFARALDPAKAIDMLRDVCGPDYPAIESISNIQMVKRYVGRRMVVRYELKLQGNSGGPTEIYCKLFRGRGGERSIATLTALAELGIEGIVFPRAIGYSSRRRSLALEAMRGFSLAEILRDERIGTELNEFGRNLAVFHCKEAAKAVAQRGLDVPLHDAVAEVGVLDLAEQRFENGELAQRSLKRYREIARRTRSALMVGAVSAPRRLIHRDLYPEQILCREGTHGLLDMDTLSLGEPELDVGNFIAHLLLADLRELGRVGGAAKIEGVFLGAYALAGDLKLSRVKVYSAATLLRLASLERLGNDTVSKLAWPELSAALLEEAEGELESFVQLSGSRSGVNSGGTSDPSR